MRTLSEIANLPDNAVLTEAERGFVLCEVAKLKEPIETPWGVYNDGGRRKAGYRGKAGDCGIRALAIAAGLDYEVCVKLLRKFSRKEPDHYRGGKLCGRSNMTGGIWRGTYRKMVLSLAQSHGIEFEWKRYRGRIFADAVPAGALILSMSSHFAAHINGVLHDTHDCLRVHGKSRRVYGYFIRRK